MKNNTVGILALFRNEAHILDEWIQHYIKQGIDHFYLVNNNSDDEYQVIIDKYRSIITLKEEPDILNQSGKIVSAGTEIQEKSYNNFLHDIETEWLLTCDLDEFVYTKNGYTNIKDLIEKRGDEFDQILMELKMFTSNDIIQQPKSVVESFTRRITLDIHKHTLPKSITRTNMIRHIQAHLCYLHEGGITVDDTIDFSTDFFGTCTNKGPEFHKVRNMFTLGDETDISNAYIVCNHYPIQSKEWFFNVKAKRGISSWPGNYVDTVEEYFRDYWDKLEGRTQIDDFELKEIS